MKQYLGLREHFLLSITSFIASSTLLTLPSQAATSAFSEGELNFINFSQSFSSIDRNNQGNTFAFANGGVVNVQNINAQTDFTTEPPEASTSAVSVAYGKNKDYIGLAETEGKIVGNFDVEAGKSFSFDFLAALDIKTSIDKLPAEYAGTSSDISFYLFDTTNIPKQSLPDFLSGLLSDTTNSINKSPLDFFTLTGNIDTLSNDDFVRTLKSQNITLARENNQFDFSGNQESATVFISGSLQRSFDYQANLTLVASRRNQARVTAPEPSLILALLLCWSLFVVSTKGKLQASASIS